MISCQRKLTAFRQRLTQIVNSIHKAKVLHRDLRAWNILVNDAGDLTVIDFDRASVGVASGTDYVHEKKRLKRLLNGHYVDDETVIGSDYIREDIREIVMFNDKEEENL